MNAFLSVVPKQIKVAAAVIFAIGVIAGPLVGHSTITGLLGLGIGLLEGMAVSAFLAAWLICLGYVYEDARRRIMPPVLWTLVALLVPNLLGFLIYFAVRRSIARPCGQCGQPVLADARFCAWCGHQGAV
jgi:hypothetical protein